jgi:hypothetical protein
MINYIIAVCIYGQPRNYNIGHDHMRTFMNRHPSFSFDFFLHAWVSTQKMSHSPWRPIDESQLSYPDVDALQNELVKLYKPLQCAFEQPIPHDIVGSYTNTKVYNESPEKIKNNAYNIISQFRSRNRVRNLFENYVLTTREEYDMVLMIRYDNLFHANVRLLNIDKTKVYIAFENGRKIFKDNHILCPPDVFLNWFDFDANFPKIANNTDIKEKMAQYREPKN